MKAVLFGASGMVGQGVLRECLGSDAVESVLLVGRTPSGATHSKVRELVRANLYDYSGVESELSGYDACFFCLGVSAGGMSEADYSRVTFDLTLAAARALLAQNPTLTFIYVSGEGTDSTEKGGTMWARVKGRTENGLLGLGFRRAYMFRPGFIRPLDGIKSKTASYRAVYALLGPVFPVVKALAPTHVTTTRNVGLAMIRVALNGYEKPVLENPDINAVAEDHRTGESASATPPSPSR
jgi:uncharacterized protein YbjT (DUF2867 family)